MIVLVFVEYAVYGYRYTTSVVPVTLLVRVRTSVTVLRKVVQLVVVAAGDASAASAGMLRARGENTERVRRAMWNSWTITRRFAASSD